jgi:GTP pyrophosphokinase
LTSRTRLPKWESLVGAKVNSRIVSLRHKLKNGEIVEVLTSKDSGPSRDWLSFVKTARARNRIKHYINQKEREDAADLGKKLLEKEARKFKTTWKKVLGKEELMGVLRDHGIPKVEDLYPAAGFGKIAPRQILSPLSRRRATTREEKPKPSVLVSAMNKVLRRQESPITVKGEDGLLVYRAKCCNPIRGEDIVGYITRGKGIAVHATSCPNLDNLLGSGRTTDVEWVDMPGEETFTVRLAISVEDRQGILAEITAAVANLKANIRESRSRTGDDGTGSVDLTVDINDTKHLQKVVRTQSPRFRTWRESVKTAVNDWTPGWIGANTVGGKRSRPVG